MMMACCMMMLSGCSKSDDGTDTPAADIDQQLIGSWDFDHEGTRTTDPHKTHWEFYTNGNCLQTTTNSHIVFFYTAKNGVITLSHLGSTTTIYYKLKNQLLMLSYDATITDDDATWYHRTSN